MKIFRIAKITSEDCVSWIIQNVFPNTQPNDWKRRNKQKIGDNIVRRFENIVTGDITSVLEFNGQIISPSEATTPPITSQPSPSSPQKTKYIFGLATVRTDDSEEDVDGYLCLSLRSDWEHERVSSDYTEEDIYHALEKYGVLPADETNFEIPRGKKMDILNAINTDPALKSLLQYNKAFQKFLIGSEGIYDFDYDKTI